MCVGGIETNMASVNKYGTTRKLDDSLGRVACGKKTRRGRQWGREHAAVNHAGGPHRVRCAPQQATGSAASTRRQRPGRASENQLAGASTYVRM